MPARTYRVDELLRVKETSPVKAEVVKRIGQSEEGLRKLVLRDVSNGSDPTARRSRFRSSSVITNPYDDVSAEDLDYQLMKRQRESSHTVKSGRYNKYSPTPSLKRNKAERLLKEHGSPPGIRVTAGGRIVPHMTSPSQSPPPRFDHNGPWRGNNNTRFGRPGPYAQPQPVNNFKGLNGYVVDMGNGNLCQIVDGELRPVQQHEGALLLYMPAPNLPMNGTPAVPYTSPSMFHPFTPAAGPTLTQQHGVSPASENAIPENNNVPTPRQIRVMEQVHAKLELELKELDRNEVLQRDSINASAKAEIVRSRIDLVNRIDESRRGIMEAKRLIGEKASTSKQSSRPHIGSAAAPSNGHPADAPLGYLNTSQGWPPQQDLPVFMGAQPYFSPYGPMAPYDAPYPFHPSMTSIPQPITNTFENMSSQLPPFAIHERPAAGSALEERHANVSTVSLSGDIRGSTDTSKAYNSLSNLDGSCAQPPRRSHAIAIKKPTDAVGKAGLNPASPVYQPHQAFEVDEHGTFVPSPTLIAEMDNLVQSPRFDHEHGYDGTHPSDSSATTADFFPHDPQQYSSHKYSQPGSHDSGINLPAWMSNNNPGGVMQQISAVGLDKYAYGVQAEEEVEVMPPALPPRRISTGSKTVSPQHEEPCDIEFISQSAFQQISPATKQQQSAHLRRSTITQEAPIEAEPLQSPTALLLDKVSQQVSNSKSSSYWEGYRTGTQRALLGTNTDDDYREGYRDGLIESTLNGATTAPMPSTQQFSPPAMFAHAMRNDSGTRIPSMPAALQQYESTPGVPHNSATTTPQKPESYKSPSARQALESPQAQLDFMAQPNVNISSSGSAHRRLKIDTNVARNPEPTSPLANRVSGRTPMSQKTVSFAKPQTAMVSHGQSYHQKAPASVAKADETANTPTLLSPRLRASPIKTVASAAMDMLRSTSSNKAPGSPEKKGIRARLQKRMDGA